MGTLQAMLAQSPELDITMTTEGGATVLTNIRAGHTCTHTNISTYMGPTWEVSGQPSRCHINISVQSVPGGG